MLRLPRLLALAVVLVGTLVPFLLMLTAVRHVPAPRAGVVATLEPVLAALIAWPAHGEALSGAQIAGGFLVIAAVAWVQAHPPDLDREAAPPYVDAGRASLFAARRDRGVADEAAHG